MARPMPPSVRAHPKATTRRRDRGHGKERVQPHRSKRNPTRHIDIGKPPNKEHQEVKHNLGATAIYGARRGDKKPG